MGPNSTSISLIDHAREGQPKAWSDLVCLYAPLVARWCQQYKIQSCDADDVVQEVFISVSRHLVNYGQTSTENSFRGWLWTIARSKIMDHLRKRRDLIPLDSQILGEWMSFEMEHERSMAEMRDDLQLLVAQALSIIRNDFSPRSWDAFWKTVALGETAGQVGEDLGMTSAAVCMCRARILRRLRETLEEF